MNENTKKSRRFQFSLRTLFVVLTVLAIWLGYQFNWIRQRHRALEELSRLNLANSYVLSVDSTAPAPWSIRLFERAVPSITVNAEIARNPQKLRELQRLFPEANICCPVDALPVSKEPGPGY